MQKSFGLKKMTVKAEANFFEVGRLVCRLFLELSDAAFLKEGPDLRKQGD